MFKRIYRSLRFRLARFLPVNHRQIFSDIYKTNTWGSNGTAQFYSGSGSDEKYASPYVSIVVNFIKQHGVKQVVDLGCGDFRIGKAIVDATGVDYTGVDVVDELVDYNNKTFGTKNIRFKSLNIVRNALPQGDLCLIRQVLQHLSNQDIAAVLKKTAKFKHLIVTEHLPNLEHPVPNLDKFPDGDIRYSKGSGIYLDLPPFNRTVKELLRVEPEEHPHSSIVTFQVFN